MTLHQIKIFRVIVKHMNFTRAAEELHLSQPSVSVQMRQLEEELGLKLFEQLGKKLHLTEAGRIFEEHAIRVVRCVEEAQEAINQYKGAYRGPMRLGASTTPGNYLLPAVLAAYRSFYPEVRISMKITNSQAIEEQVLRNEIDFGFVGGDVKGQGIKVEPYVTDEILLIVAPGHPLAGRTKCRPAELKKENFIMRETGSSTRAVVENAIESPRLTLRVDLVLQNPEAIKQAVAEGLGVSMLSKFAVKTELSSGRLRALRLNGKRIERQLHIIYHKNKKLTEPAHRLLKLAREHPLTRFLVPPNRNPAS